MKEIVVIGYGNPLRGDDGVGWYIVRLLSANYPSDHISYVTVHQLLPELAEQIGASRMTIFVDCSMKGKPGTINRSMLKQQCAPYTSHHHITPEGLLTTAYSLYGSRGEGILFTVTGASFEYAESLSPRVERSAVKVVREITRYLRELERAGQAG